MQVEIKPHPIPFVKAALFSLGAAILCGLLVLPILFSGSKKYDSGHEAIFILFALITVALMVGIACFLSLRQIGGSFAGTLALEPDLIRWRPARGQIVEIPYGVLWAASSVGQGPRERLILQAQQPELVINFQKQSLASPELANTLLEQILERVESLPEGQGLRARIESRQALARQLDSQGDRAALGIAGVLVLVFMVEVGFGALRDPARMLALGANAPDLVAKGEVFRLATSNLLHAGLVHLLANLVALLAWGSILERLFGKSFFLTLFLASALAGAALSAGVGVHEMSVGASTGICGLLAAEAILSWRWADQLSTPPPKRRWVHLIWLLFVVLVSGGKRVDHLGHLGGFIAGGLLMIPRLRETDLLGMHLRHRKVFCWTSILLVLVFLIACGMIPLVWPRSR